MVNFRSLLNADVLQKIPAFARNWIVCGDYLGKRWRVGVLPKTCILWLKAKFTESYQQIVAFASSWMYVKLMAVMNLLSKRLIN